MMILNENMLAEVLQGCLDGRFVLRKCKGQVVVSRKPAKRAGLSESQQKQVSRFKEATAYAKAAIADEEICKWYSERAEESDRNLSAYNVAVSDFLHCPVIGDIDLRRYSGKLGDEIRIIATDDFKVAGVMVEVLRDDGSLLEVGMAGYTPGNPEEWVYYAQSGIACLAGYKVNVRVTDLPGNVAEKTVSL